MRHPVKATPNGGVPERTMDAKPKLIPGMLTNFCLAFFCSNFQSLLSYLLAFALDINKMKDKDSTKALTYSPSWDDFEIM